MVAFVVACRAERPAREALVVGAAASLADALEALRPMATERGIALVINAAGSNVIAQQIEASDAIDVFLSADADWVDHLAVGERVRPDTRCAFLSNRLSVVAATTSDHRYRSLRALAEDPPRHLVLADPSAVPAGRYARQALERTMLAPGESAWRRLRDRVAATADVRAALAMTAADPSAVGIVYASDLRGPLPVRRLFDVPSEVGPAIRYTGVAVAGQNDARTRRFLRFLAEPAAARVFADHGFEPLPCPRWTPASPTPSA